MAKRKSRRAKLAAPKKVQPKLDVEFTCPFCDHPESVACTFDSKLKIGEACCRTCGESYATAINGLTEPIDIYSEWLDACEESNKDYDQEFCKSKRQKI